MVAREPRSTWSHCGSLNALAQRVPVLPSTAAAAGVPAFSVDEAVAGRPWESRVGAACAGVVAPVGLSAATRATVSPTSRCRTARRGRGRADVA